MGNDPRKTALSTAGIDPLLKAAREGSQEALGQLLAAYRSFLLAAAIEELDSELKAKAGPSDLVQETFIDAHRDFGNFTTGGECEFRIWLHSILMNNLADLRKKYLKTAKRQVRRERRLGTYDSKLLFQEPAASEGHSPANAAISQEEEARIQEALLRLPPAYQQIIRLRSQQRQQFGEIAKSIGKSPDAARMLWQRAVSRLQRELEGKS
ncbi:MAG TPA: sigma-70 family RNA polymerase sigma factor [Pirellulales bacterium]|jgi:RNA polymerase sigma-70 factor (ECF subfamily)